MSQAKANAWHHSPEGQAAKTQAGKIAAEASRSDRTCLKCQKVFSGVFRAKYCSDKCRTAKYESGERRVRNRAMEVRECLRCLKPFTCRKDSEKFSCTSDFSCRVVCNEY